MKPADLDLHCFQNMSLEKDVYNMVIKPLMRQS